MVSAYTECNDWLNEIRLYIEDNAQFACKYMKDHIPTLSVTKPEGSFYYGLIALAYSFLKMSALNCSKKKEKLLLSLVKYGLGGEEHIRINIGCPRSVLEEILNRLRHTFS